ncbi:YbcC family protein [Corallococcus terminator]
MSHATCLTSPSEDRGTRLRAALARASHVLPAQGPIGVFVHHNTLHAFQHLPFHEAVATASQTFGAEGYLSEERFLELYRQGRITDEDLRAVLAEPGAPRVTPPGKVSWDATALTLLALLHPVEEESEASLRWKLEERSAADRFRADLPSTTRQALLHRSTEGVLAWMERVGRDWTMTELACALLDPDLASTVRAEASRVTTELATVFGGDGSPRSLRERLEHAPETFAVRALWSACRTTKVSDERSDPPRTTEPHGHREPQCETTGEGMAEPRSHRELLRETTGEDVNDLVHPLLIRACAAFLDEGIAHWNLPGREHGLHAAWVAMMRDGVGVAPDWLDGLEDDLVAEPEHTVLGVLDELAVAEADWEPYLVRVLLALPGWAGMMHRLEHHPGDRAQGAPPARLLDFVAVRLTLERRALREVARRRLDDTGPLSGLSQVARPALESTQAASWRLFQWAQLLGLSAMDVAGLPLRARRELLAGLEGFDASARRRVWQEAYEHHYRSEVCRGLASNRLRPESERTVTAPRFQMMCCMDDREESFRRHFEELDARHETFGIAGFFGVAFDYRGLDDASHVALCPVVVTPAHVVEEQASAEHQPLAETRARRRSLWARIDQLFQQGTHALELSWLFVPLLGLLSALVLPWHLLFPRARGRLRRALSERCLPRPSTRLTSLREPEAHRASPTLKPRGFTLDEKAARVAAALESLGLVKDFAPLVVVLGHGAVSVNNPHQAAYDCGACGGRHGGPNARLFAEMANRPEVRARLRERGLRIPDATWFIGGLHNTTTDEVTLYDTQALPESAREELVVLRAALDRARALSAQERCRRFESAPLGLSAPAALRHVEARAEDLGQPRPELGHVTNAACIVGRRALTRGLFLDRRAFLISYDASQDASGAIVERILLAAGPVGAGISLEYYFSCVDNERHGCGTKLPHNLTGLLGVMDGAEGDLRTGLPRQMIELHEPMRLLLIVEASTRVLSSILARQPALQELIGQEWVQLVSVDPVTGEQQRFTRHGFQSLTQSETRLPEVASSPHWYQGHRDFLPPALIRAPAPRPSGADRHASA